MGLCKAILFLYLASGIIVVMARASEPLSRILPPHWVFSVGLVAAFLFFLSVGLAKKKPPCFREGRIGELVGILFGRLPHWLLSGVRRIVDGGLGILHPHRGEESPRGSLLWSLSVMSGASLLSIPVLFALDQPRGAWWTYQAFLLSLGLFFTIILNYYNLAISRFLRKSRESPLREVYQDEKDKIPSKKFERYITFFRGLVVMALAGLASIWAWARFLSGETSRLRFLLEPTLIDGDLDVLATLLLSFIAVLSAGLLVVYFYRIRWEKGEKRIIDSELSGDTDEADNMRDRRQEYRNVQAILYAPMATFVFPLPFLLSYLGEHWTLPFCHPLLTPGTVTRVVILGLFLASTVFMANTNRLNCPPGGTFIKIIGSILVLANVGFTFGLIFHNVDKERARDFYVWEMAKTADGSGEAAAGMLGYAGKRGWLAGERPSGLDEACGCSWSTVRPGEQSREGVRLAFSYYSHPGARRHQLYRYDYGMYQVRQAGIERDPASEVEAAYTMADLADNSGFDVSASRLAKKGVLLGEVVRRYYFAFESEDEPILPSAILRPGGEGRPARVWPVEEGGWEAFHEDLGEVVAGLAGQKSFGFDILGLSNDRSVRPSLRNKGIGNNAQLAEKRARVICSELKEAGYDANIMDVGSSGPTSDGLLRGAEAGFLSANASLTGRKRSGEGVTGYRAGVLRVVSKPLDHFFRFNDRFDTSGINYTQSVTLADALFYSSYTVTTTGYGIVPLAEEIKLYTALENVFELVIISILVAAALSERIKPSCLRKFEVTGVRRRSRQEDAETPR
ncbi:ion channel [Desulfohalovibrio reitneri]|uniref:ion channel n=1 Tax=Desulfohalovibrio reitneri TaxID=1307759 RepID=UPI0004A70B2B|nr:ion channel [Desulfohalovibrio reitneri]